MHDAVAATEVVCDASRKLVANAMHCQTTRLQAPRGMRLDRHLLCCCCLCWKPTRRNESDEFRNSEQSVSRFSAFGWRSGFSLSSAKLLVKVSIDIFVCFPLASSAGRSVHTPGSHKTPAATLRRKVVYQLAGWAGKWNAVPLTLNNQALDPFSKDLSLSGGYIY